MENTQIRSKSNSNIYVIHVIYAIFIFLKQKLKSNKYAI